MDSNCEPCSSNYGGLHPCFSHSSCIRKYNYAPTECTFCCALRKTMDVNPAAKECLQNIQRDITRLRQKCRKPFVDAIFSSMKDNIQFGGIYRRNIRKVNSTYLKLKLRCFFTKTINNKLPFPSTGCFLLRSSTISPYFCLL